MSKIKVIRPVWRKFHEKYVSRAVDWVHQGGLAAVCYDDGKIDMLFLPDENGELNELSLWALLSIEQRRTKEIESGPTKGLLRANVRSHARYAVMDWCERDSVYDAATRTLRLDCLECGACCHEANVILADDDLETFREAGREDLCSSKFIKKSRDGKIRLRFAPSGKCQHLKTDLKCRIYPIRPYNCSVFPVGSEACLAARESTHGWRDAARP